MAAGCTLAACGGGVPDTSVVTNPAPSTAPTKAASTVQFDYSRFSHCNTSACAGDIVAASHVDQFFWTSQKVYDETVLPIQGKTTYGLWRPVFEIETVRNRQTGAVYVPGTDYILQGGKFVIPTGSTIPQVASNWLQTVPPGVPSNWHPIDKQGNPLRIAQDYQQNQIAITYSTPIYPIPAPLVTKWPVQFQAKLKAGQPVAITYVGDSITHGDGSTASYAVAPNQPGYTGLIDAYLSAKYPGQVYSRNNAVGGTTSNDGAANAMSLVGDTPSDLIVIAYGMNDATTGVSKAQFEANLTTIINAARAVNPSVEFLLVSSWGGNANWYPMNSQAFVDYNGDMYDLSYSMQGVSVADVTTVMWAGMGNKAFADITSNGVNHPNDFMAVVYAQTVLKTLLAL
jgi:acyl-CoA thioesterase-1